MKLKDLGILPKEHKYSIRADRNGEFCLLCRMHKPCDYNKALKRCGEVEIEVGEEKILKIIVSYRKNYNNYYFVWRKDFKNLAQAIAKALPTILRKKDEN